MNLGHELFASAAELEYARAEVRVRQFCWQGTARQVRTRELMTMKPGEIRASFFALFVFQVEGVDSFDAGVAGSDRPVIRRETEPTTVPTVHTVGGGSKATKRGDILLLVAGNVDPNQPVARSSQKRICRRATNSASQHRRRKPAPARSGRQMSRA